MNNECVREFMDGSLVTWIRSFESDGGQGLSYPMLTDGVFLYDVLTHVSPPSVIESGGEHRPLNRYPEDSRSRLANLALLWTFIRAFYKDVLSSVVLLPIPDVVELSKSPENDASIAGTRTLVLLVLGCAVQSPLKEEVIKGIKELPIETQQGIVHHIQEITDNPQAVWPSEWNSLDAVPESSTHSAFETLVHHCSRLASERDNIYQSYLNTLLSNLSNSQQSEDGIHHLGVQLADEKGKNRRLRQDCDEKTETISELKEDLDQTKSNLSRLRQENLDLVQDARSARSWRDEADILRERAAKADALEADYSRLRDKMSDIEFYRTRVEELREDNRILSETKEMLEEQLASARRRAEQVMDCENTIIKLKQNINHLNGELDVSQGRIEDLQEENAQLQLSTRTSISESANLSRQMERLRALENSGPGRDFGAEVSGDSQSRIIQLELIIQQLESECDRLKREAQTSLSEEKATEMEKESKRLDIKVSSLQSALQAERSVSLTCQEDVESKTKEVFRLKETISTIKENSDRQRKELQTENLHMHELISTLRDRQKKTDEGRVADVDRENRQLQDNNLQMQTQISRLEHEKQQLQQLSERLKASSEALTEAELQRQEVERENKELKRALTQFKESCERHDKLESDYVSLEVEFSRVSRSLDTTRDTVNKLESTQSENIRLQTELNSLRKSMSTFRADACRLAEAEAERDQMNLQVAQLEKKCDANQGAQLRVDQLEIDIASLTTQLQKAQRSSDQLQRKLSHAEKEKGDLESENTKLERSIESLRVQTKKLNELERELTDIESSNDRLDRENRSLKKEVDRLKSSLELKGNLLEETSSKMSTLERENRKLNKETTDGREKQNRILELEHAKREWEQCREIEKRALGDLRDELVQEKVRSQQLSTQLDKFISDLSNVGIHVQNIRESINGESHDQSQKLETILTEWRDTKISSLDTRLKESLSTNNTLRKQLTQSISDHESLSQRLNGVSNLNFDSGKEVERMRETVGRTEEEKNLLENDIQALSMQSASYREQVITLQGQVCSLSSQNTQMSRLNASLQGENAALQVENTTLQSQSTSLISQISQLQINSTMEEKDKDKVRHECEERGDRLSQLVIDHESLENLHKQLTHDYEELSNEYQTLKSQHKTQKQEAKELKDRLDSLSANEDDLINLREVLEAEMSNLKNDSSSLKNLRAEHSRLKEDFRSLFSANERLKHEYRNLQTDHKRAKGEVNSFKLKITQINGELNENRDTITQLDVQAAKLTNKCQVLQSLNASLESDRRSLMSQVSLLLSQYHDLLTQTLDDKQHFHQEEKLFSDRVNHLRRQKEKLEEKIMEQYRRMDNSPNKKKGFGSTLVKRVRKAGNDLINKVPRTARSRSRGRDEDQGSNPDSSSSMGSSPDSGEDVSPSSLGHLDREDGNNNRSSQRSSIPGDIATLFRTPSMGGSLSSVDSILEQSREIEGTSNELQKVTPEINLNRAGSRKPLYVGTNSDRERESDTDSFGEPGRGRPKIRNCSTLNPALERNSPISNGHATIGAFPSNIISSTPKPSVSKLIMDCEQNTPKLPPRKENNNTGAPQLPPKGRKGSLITTPDSSLSSTHSITLEPRLKAPPPLPPSNLNADGRKAPPPPPVSQNSDSRQAPPIPPPKSNSNNKSDILEPPDLPSKPGSQDKINNPVWYEYGCV